MFKEIEVQVLGFRCLGVLDPGSGVEEFSFRSLEVYTGPTYMRMHTCA